MSSTQVMRHMISDDVIREVTDAARIFSAQQAKEWGFLNDIVDNPLEHIMKVAPDISESKPNAIPAANELSML